MQRLISILFNNPYHFVASTNEDSDGPRIFALLDHQHPVLGRAERQFSDDTGVAELFRRQLLETRHDSATGGDGYELWEIEI